MTAPADAFAPLEEKDLIPPRQERAARNPNREAIMPVPSHAPRPDSYVHPSLGRPQCVWEFKDEEGRLLFAEARWDGPNGKQVRPLVFCQDGTEPPRWTASAPPKPWPLFGRENLARRPLAPVIVAEGAKAAEAAGRLLPDYVAIAGLHGAHGVEHSDWSFLKGRHVVIATDADAPGCQFGQDLARLLRAAGVASLSILPGQELGRFVSEGGMLVAQRDAPAGWDLADAEEMGWTPEMLADLLGRCPELLQPGWEEVPPSPPPGSLKEQIRAAQAALPAGFELTAHGLYQHPEGNSRMGDERGPVRLGAPLVVVARTADERSENHGRLLLFEDGRGIRHEVPLPIRLLVGDRAEWLEILGDLGYEFEPGRGARNGLHRYIMKTRPPAWGRCVSRVGWHCDGERNLFVLPDMVFGQADRERVVFQQDRPIAHHFRAAGTLDDWQQRVGQLCEGNSRLILGVSAGLAAPLLFFVDETGAGIHFFGRSTTGKTTAAMVAASVWGGGGNRGSIRTWRATANGLESIALLHSDSLLVLDELSEVEPREAGPVAYMLANGSGKSRARCDGAARPPATWRLIYLSTGEYTLADKIAEDGRGRRPTAGQQVRLVDVPDDAGAGLGIFENLHGRENARAFAEELRASALAVFGSPARSFLEALFESGLTETVETLREARRRFVAEIAGGAAPQVQRVAAIFGLIGAAGELATAFGVLPWPQGTAVEAAKTCFGAWLQNRGGTGHAEDEAAVAAVMRFIELHGESRFTPLDQADGDRPTVNRAGFRRRIGEKPEFCFLPEVFRTEVCAGLVPQRVAQALAARGMLLREGKHLQCKRTLPGMGYQRVYVVTPVQADFEPEGAPAKGAEGGDP